MRDIDGFPSAKTPFFTKTVFCWVRGECGEVFLRISAQLSSLFALHFEDFPLYLKPKKTYQRVAHEVWVSPASFKSENPIFSPFFLSLLQQVLFSSLERRSPQQCRRLVTESHFRYLVLFWLCNHMLMTCITSVVRDLSSQFLFLSSSPRRVTLSLFLCFFRSPLFTRFSFNAIDRVHYISRASCIEPNYVSGVLEECNYVQFLARNTAYQLPACAIGLISTFST